MSDRLYPPELSDRFRGFFFALVFALLKRASLLKTNKQTIPRWIKAKEIEPQNHQCQFPVLQSAAAVILQVVIPCPTSCHQLLVPALLMHWHNYSVNYSRGGGAEIQEEEKKILSNLDLVSGLVHCTKTSAETEEDTAAAQAGTATQVRLNLLHMAAAHSKQTTSKSALSSVLISPKLVKFNKLHSWSHFSPTQILPLR